MSRRPAEFHYYDWDFNLWFGSETRANCKALPGDYPMGLLANAAEGAYRNLLDYCYKQGDIPGDLGGLAALCGMAPEVFEIVWPAFRKKFQVHKSKTGRLVHDKVSIRLRAWKQKRKQKADAGEESSKKRRINNTHENNNLSNGTSTEVHTRSTGVEQEVRSKKKEVRSKNNTIADELASRLWARHPKCRRDTLSEVKKKLHPVFAKIVKSEQPGLSDQIDREHDSMCSSEQWQKNGGEYAKGLKNWISANADRWASDDPIEPIEPNLFAHSEPKKLLITELYRD